MYSINVSTVGRLPVSLCRNLEIESLTLAFALSKVKTEAPISSSKVSTSFEVFSKSF